MELCRAHKSNQTEGSPSQDALSSGRVTFVCSRLFTAILLVSVAQRYEQSFPLNWHETIELGRSDENQRAASIRFTVANGWYDVLSIERESLVSIFYFRR